MREVFFMNEWFSISLCKLKLIVYLNLNDEISKYRIYKEASVGLKSLLSNVGNYTLLFLKA